MHIKEFIWLKCKVQCGWDKVAWLFDGNNIWCLVGKQPTFQNFAKIRQTFVRECLCICIWESVRSGKSGIRHFSQKVIPILPINLYKVFLFQIPFWTDNLVETHQILKIFWSFSMIAKYHRRGRIETFRGKASSDWSSFYVVILQFNPAVLAELLWDVGTSL